LSDVIDALFENVDRKYAEFNRKLLPDTDNILGVRMPVLRKIASEIMNREWRSFLETDSEYHEEYLLKALVIANADMVFEERIALTRRFAPCVKNWAVCDLLCNDWKHNPDYDEELWTLCDEFFSSGEEFKMRMAAVMLLFKFIDGKNIDRVLNRLVSVHHDGYYYKMGSAWTLSYCYILFPDKTENILISGKLNPEIQNMTVRKVCESRRADDTVRERIRKYRR